MNERKRLLNALAVSALVAWVNGATAQSRLTEHTYRLASPDDRPAATLEDVAWLAGLWEGEAFGGTFEEVWNPPSGGSMVGMYKTLNGDRVGFYELMLIVEEAGSLNLKVKHFNADFSAWEEKKDFVNFGFVKADESAIHFSGLSFYRINDQEVHGYIVLRQGDRVREEKMIYRRRE